MKVFSYLVLAGSIAFGPLAFAQRVASPSTAPTTPSNVPNPFDEEYNSGGMGMMMGMDSGSGMDDMGGGPDLGGMSMDMGGGMGMGAGDMYGKMHSPEDLFRFRLKNAIKRIGVAKSEQEKAALTQYTEKGISDYYDAMIIRRKKDLERLKESLSNLELDLAKREEAKDRVVKLQLQSAILAAEGLLDLNGLQPTSAEAGGGMSGGMGMGMGN